MKFFLFVCLLATIAHPFAESKSFRISDFFGENHENVKRSSSPSDIKTETSSNISTASSDEIDADLVMLNASLYDEFINLDAWNTSGSTQNSSDSDGTSSAPKQSMKKDLGDSSSTEFPITDMEQKSSQEVSSSGSVATSDDFFNVTSKADEVEEVVLGTTVVPDVLSERTIFQKSIEWMEDAYTLSILIPVAAGVLFATTCILTIAICGCVRRCCRRRRLRRKILPDSVKNLRASDRARLLGDCSSDEEF